MNFDPNFPISMKVMLPWTLSPPFEVTVVRIHMWLHFNFFFKLFWWLLKFKYIIFVKYNIFSIKNGFYNVINFCERECVWGGYGCWILMFVLGVENNCLILFTCLSDPYNSSKITFCMHFLLLFNFFLME